VRERTSLLKQKSDNMKEKRVGSHDNGVPGSEIRQMEDGEDSDWYQKELQGVHLAIIEAENLESQELEESHKKAVQGIGERMWKMSRRVTVQSWGHDQSVTSNSPYGKGSRNEKNRFEGWACSIDDY
jgi:hypothetical protein